jgi:hypothetical protein
VTSGSPPIPGWPGLSSRARGGGRACIAGHAPPGRPPGRRASSVGGSQRRPAARALVRVRGLPDIRWAAAGSHDFFSGARGCQRSDSESLGSESRRVRFSALDLRAGARRGPGSFGGLSESGRLGVKLARRETQWQSRSGDAVTRIMMLVCACVFKLEFQLQVDVST